MKLRLYNDGLMVVMTTHQWLMISLTLIILFPLCSSFCNPWLASKPLI